MDAVRIEASQRRRRIAFRPLSCFLDVPAGGECLAFAGQDQNARPLVDGAIQRIDDLVDHPGIGECVPAVIARQRQLGYAVRSEEHTSELQSLMRISYAVFCLKKTRE